MDENNGQDTPMIWENDKYKDLKYKILDLLVSELHTQDVTRVTMEMAYQGIDKLFDHLLKMDE